MLGDQVKLDLCGESMEYFCTCGRGTERFLVKELQKIFISVEKVLCIMFWGVMFWGYVLDWVEVPSGEDTWNLYQCH